MIKCFTPEDFKEKIIKRVKVNDMTLTDEQMKAIEQCHNSLFIAEMGSIYAYDEYKRTAIKNLQKHFADRIVNFIGDFYNNNDTIIFESEE